MVDHRGINTFLATEVVRDRGLIHPCRLRQGAGTDTLESILGE
ncbi:Uncharacterised protein [Mycobacteroides abscessus subsp. abscessus]|nr:Uncharacterised protein [Mycobacteroides abscessus subsp. abscessus]SLE90662.1 Uncharacterised protein [Mycobacteroides abscessus subsp. massiliense]